MAASVAIGLRTAFVVLGCIITATVIYTTVTDGLPFRKELLTPWMAATLVDFYINILAIGAWIVYKESSWIRALIWIVLLVCLGSITTCLYIVVQFLKLSSQESIQDPIYFVLKNKKKDEAESGRIVSVASARVLFSFLGCLMLGTLVYTIATDGSPFRKDLLTPWLTATLIDFYVNVIALSVWVAYKEPNWLTAAFWILLLICFGSVSTCVYIVLQLFRLSSQDPVSLVLFSSRDIRAGNNYEKAAQADRYM
ncbi:XK-related protein 2 [Striga asiatica]|uniref:XK-related protein 2 n=1 Tax=Striga asiatica TaxID=4170 RepID=A0A5A7PM15_STRAF|nr:XK-related protein 2 [Striga asiatica]